MNIRPFSFRRCPLGACVLTLTLLHLTGCGFFNPGLDGNLLKTLRQNAAEEGGRRIQAEIRRCTTYYPGKSPDSEFVRAGNPPFDRQVKSDGSIVYAYGLYAADHEWFHIRRLDKTTFELPVDEEGRIRECLVRQESYEAEKPAKK